MKTKVLIIEDNMYKFFTTKQVLETQLNIKVQVEQVDAARDVVGKTCELAPDMIVFRPHGGVVELLEKMKKRRANRRNTEITLLITQDLEDQTARRMQEFVASYPKRIAAAA